MYGKLQVLRSAAGYYLGRLYRDEEGLDGFEGPGTRESGYYPTHEAVVQAVREGFALRECPENEAVFRLGDIHSAPGDFYQDATFCGVGKF